MMVDFSSLEMPALLELLTVYTEKFKFVSTYGPTHSDYASYKDIVLQLQELITKYSRKTVNVEKSPQVKRTFHSRSL